MVENDLKGGNSNASKTTSAKQAPITSNVIVKKESEGAKFKKKFFAEDVKTVGGHVVDSVIIPSLQKILSDVVKGGIDYLIYGSKGARSNSGPGLISYSNYYNRGGFAGGSTYTSPINGNSPNQPTLYSVNEVVFPERADAEEVLLKMRESIASYGMVSVADFYDLINQRCSFTDQKWGWRDLRTADVIRVDAGFSIRFPRVSPLE